MHLDTNPNSLVPTKLVVVPPGHALHCLGVGGWGFQKAVVLFLLLLQKKLCKIMRTKDVILWLSSHHLFE